MSETTTQEPKTQAAKGKTTPHNVEIKGTEKPAPGGTHTYKNGSGTTVKTHW